MLHIQQSEIGLSLSYLAHAQPLVYVDCRNHVYHDTRGDKIYKV